MMSVDVMGVTGEILNYALIIAFGGSAALIFLYLWRKGKLDMDEEPKWQMMKEREEDGGRK